MIVTKYSYKKVTNKLNRILNETDTMKQMYLQLQELQTILFCDILFYVILVVEDIIFFKYFSVRSLNWLK